MISFIIRGKQHLYTILRKTEKYTKADMVYLAKGGFWITFGQSISTLLSLVLIVAFANLLPKETYGTYRYILSLASVLNIFALTGMNSAVARSVAIGHEGVLRTAVKYQLKWNLLMFAAFFILGGYYFAKGDIQFATSFFILGVFVPPTLALNTYGAYLEGKKDFKTASVSSVTSTSLYVMGVLAAILLSGSVIWLITAYALTTFTATLLFYIFIIRKFKPPPAMEAEETLKYGRELSFIGLIAPISSQIDKILLTHFWGPAQLAVYSLAMAVPDRAVSIIKNWVGIGFPKFSTKTPEEINTVFYRRIAQGMAGGAIFTIAYILISPYLFKYVIPQYLEGVFYSQILAINFIFAMPIRYLSLLFESQKFSRIIFIKSLIQNSIAIALYIILGIWGGILGLVIAQITNSFIGMVVNIIIWKHATLK